MTEYICRYCSDTPVPNPYGICERCKPVVVKASAEERRYMRNQTRRRLEDILRWIDSLV